MAKSSGGPAAAAGNGAVAEPLMGTEFVEKTGVRLNDLVEVDQPELAQFADDAATTYLRPGTRRVGLWALRRWSQVAVTTVLA